MGMTAGSRKTVLVIGGTRGIGAAAAEAVGRDGARVIVSGRTLGGAESAAQRLAGLDINATGITFDVSDPVASAAAVEEALAKHGQIDSVVASAGISPYFSRAEDLTPEMWDHVIDTNLRGIFFVVQAAAKPMLARRSGSIVLVSSVTSMAGVPRALPYSAGKAGIDAIARTLAVEWADRGVRVNGVAPGWVSTEMTGALRENEKLSQWLVLDKVPMKRFGSAEEVGAMIAFLVSDRASYVTGQTFVVDGGFLAA
jgi:3-oxoacyl-[acyl-carrier protein] reductase